MELLHKVALELEEINHIPHEQFLELFRHAEIWKYAWGAIFAIQNEMHIHVLKDYRKKVYLKPYIVEAILETFKHYPVLKTSVSKLKPSKLIVNYKAMGWRLVGETKDKWLLEMEKKDFKYVKN